MTDETVTAAQLAERMGIDPAQLGADIARASAAPPTLNRAQRRAMARRRDKGVSR